MYHLVYLTTNLINNKIYVGVHSTYNLEDGYLGSGVALRRSVKKYGKENFKRQILYFCLSEKDMVEIETNLVNEWFLSKKNIYNMSLGGKGGNMLKFLSQEAKLEWSRKQSLSHQGKKSPWTEERKIKHQKEHRAFRKGDKHSEKTKRILSEKARLRTCSEETKKKISESNSGKVWSEESKAKLSKTNKGRPIPEHQRILGAERQSPGIIVTPFGKFTTYMECYKHNKIFEDKFLHYLITHEERLVSKKTVEKYSFPQSWIGQSWKELGYYIIRK